MTKKPRDDEMPKKPGEIIPGITWGRWHKEMFAAMRDPKNGLREFASTARCHGGYCNRHSEPNPKSEYAEHWMHPRGQIKFKTSTGLKLCLSCAKIWATRKRLGLAHGNEDL